MSLLECIRCLERWGPRDSAPGTSPPAVHLDGQSAGSDGALLILHAVDVTRTPVLMRRKGAPELQGDLAVPGSAPELEGLTGMPVLEAQGWRGLGGHGLGPVEGCLMPASGPHTLHRGVDQQTKGRNIHIRQSPDVEAALAHPVLAKAPKEGVMSEELRHEVEHEAGGARSERSDGPLGGPAG